MEDALYYNDLGDNLDPSLFEFTAGSGHADNVNLDAGKAIAYAASNWFFGSVDYEYIGRIGITLTPGEGVATASTAIPASTGGWALGGAGVWVSTLPDESVSTGIGGWALGGAGVWVSTIPGDTVIPAIDAATGLPTESLTGFVFAGGTTEAGVEEVVSTFPLSDEIVTEEGGGFVFCDPETTGGAATAFPATEVIEASGGFAFGGAGVWSQVAPGDLPSTVLVGSGGFVLSGSGLSLDPAITPTATVIVSTGGWKLGGIRMAPVDVTYPTSVDRVIISSGGFEFCGDEGVWEARTPGATIIVSKGAIFALGGAGLATTKSPPIAVITGDGGFALGGTGWPAGGSDTWVLSGNGFEPSLYSNFDFNAFAQFRGKYYGAGADGIFLLEGDTDDGDEIVSGVRIGPTNLGSANQKRLRTVSIGEQGNGARVRISTGDKEGVSDVVRGHAFVARNLQGALFVIDILGFDEVSHIELVPLVLSW
jgi:hypothetical protein